jgi:hypothetical protein
MAIVILASVGFVSMLTTSYLAAEKYNENDRPSSLFRVIVEFNDGSKKESDLRSIRWSELVNYKHSKDYKFYVGEPEEKIGNTFFEVIKISPGTKLVKLRHNTEAYMLYNTYYVDDGKFKPVYFRVMDRGDAVFATLVTFIFTPIFLIIFVLIKKIYKNLKAKTEYTLPVDS